MSAETTAREHYEQRSEQAIELVAFYLVESLRQVSPDEAILAAEWIVPLVIRAVTEGSPLPEDKS